MTSVVPSKPATDLYRSITNKIVAAIEAGAGSFEMPWHGAIVPPAFPVNAATNKPYRGINVVALWAEAAVARYISGTWASYRQWRSLGAQVRKGERGSLIIFYKLIENTDDEGGEEEGVRQRFVARASYVFNAAQVDGWQPPTPSPHSQIKCNDEMEAFLGAIGPVIKHGAHMACYRRDLDCIEMPSPEWFVGTSTSTPAESYYAVLCHETVHWSGAPHRLDREFGKRFGDQAYAFEELVAELGAAFLCSQFRIVNAPRPDHAAYIASWLSILKGDSKAIFKAARKAQEAVEYLKTQTTERAHE